MHTAQLTEIVRQLESPALLAVVKDMAEGKVLSGIQKLRDQNRVHEYTNRKERFDEMAKQYVSLEGKILVVATDNLSRIDISKRIHVEMQAVGSVSKDEQTVTVLVNRQSVTNEDQQWAQKFAEGDVLRYVKSNKTIGVAAREYVRVDIVDGKTNMVTVTKEDGQQLRYNGRLIQGVQVFREEERTFAKGDRLQFTYKFRSKDIANREMANHNDKFEGEATMNSNADTTQQQPHRQTAQEAIAANVQALIEQLEQGRSETLSAYLGAMARFHRYSFGNILSIAHHSPDATHVAGFHTWNELGRHVMKGQKGIPIQAPMIGSRRQRDERPTEQGNKPAPTLIGFRTVYIFDISQTEGAERPQPTTVSGEVGGHRDRLIEFVAQQGIELEYNERIAPAQGVSYGGRIALLPGQSKAEEFATLVHELAHEILHRSERRATTSKKVAVGALYRALHAQAWKLAESG